MDKEKLDLSFEEAFKELQDLVKKMEQGTLPLSDTVAAYEKGMLLKAHCGKMLKDAELKIEQLNPQK